MAKRNRSARDNARRRAAEHKTGGGDFLRAFKAPEGIKILKIKDDTTRRFDILGYDVEVDHNPWADKGDFHFERTYFTHRIPDPSSDRGYSSQVTCPKKTFGMPCPICEYIADNPDEKLAESAKVKERQLWNVVAVTDTEKGVQLWDYSVHCFGNKLDAELNNADEDDDFDLFADWSGGKTLKVAWETKSTGDGSKFYDATSINFKDRKEDYKNPKVVDLDAALVLYTYDTLQALINGEEITPVQDTVGGAPSKKKKEAPKEEKEEEPEPTDDADDGVDEEAAAQAEAKEKKESDARAKKSIKEKEAKKAKDAARKKAADEEAAKDAEAAGDDDEGEDAPEVDGDNPCPSGFVFGTDCDEHNECNDCDVDCWQKCFEYQKELKAK
jgi:hypothetical protein